MKQFVNLLRDDLKPVVQRLTLKRLVLVVALLMLLIASVWGYLGYLEDKSSSRLSTLQAQLEQLQQRQQQLEQQLEQRRPSQALAQKSAQLDEQINAQQQLNQQLSSQQSTFNAGPEQLMQELSRVDIEGLWLSEFSMTPAGVSLAGKTIRANLLPRWMKRFENMPLLSQSRFAVVDLDLNADGEQTFELTNQAASASDNSSTNNSLTESN